MNFLSLQFSNHILHYPRCTEKVLHNMCHLFLKLQPVCLTLHVLDDHSLNMMLAMVRQSKLSIGIGGEDDAVEEIKNCPALRR